MNINELILKIHADNVKVGWWDDPDRCLYTVVQLISTEIAEATEGERKNLMDTHLKHRKMGEVELADVLVRLLDLAGFLGLRYQPLYISDYLPPIVILDVYHSHYVLNKLLFSVGPLDMSDYWLTKMVQMILLISEKFNYDIENAMLEKLEYNKTRKDHTRKARSQANGKKV